MVFFNHSCRCFHVYTGNTSVYSDLEVHNVVIYKITWFIAISTMFEVTCVLLLSVLIAGTVVDARNPGFKTRITANGLNYVNKVALQVLKKSAETIRIPDRSGKEHGFKYTISNIHVTSFSLPDSAIVLLPKQGLKWKGTGAAMEMAGNFHYKKWHVSSGGSFTASVSGVDFSLAIGMATDKNGRPSIAAQSCDSGVGDVNFKFHGGMSWLYNLFRDKLGHVIRDKLNERLCPLINNEINVDAENKLASLPVIKQLGKKFLLDYRLTQNPTFTSSYMETSHKGEIYWYANQTEAPMEAPAMPETTDSQQMLYFWLSDYVFDTIGYVAQTNGYLVYNLTAEDLPPSTRSALDTTCSGFIPMCIGKLIPEIGDKYPNTHVDLHMRSTVAPVMKIAPSGISVKCGGNIDMCVKTKTGVVVLLATLNATMLVNVNISMANEKLYGNVINLTFNLGVVKSNIGPIKPNALQLMINEALQVVLMKKLNDLGSEGVPLPVTGEVRFVNTTLKLMQDALFIATDLSYSHGGFLQKEMNEMHGLVYKPKALPVGANYKMHNQL